MSRWHALRSTPNSSVRTLSTSYSRRTAAPSIARDLGVNHETLRGWVGAAKKTPCQAGCRS